MRHGVRNGKGNGGGYLLVVDSGVFGWCYVDWVVFILFDLILRIFPGLTLTGRFCCAVPGSGPAPGRVRVGHKLP